MRDLDVRCPVCNRCVSIVGKNKIARHNNYAAASVCNGSGADATQLAEVARRRVELETMEVSVNSAERRLRHARAEADKATAWATECLDTVTRLRAKLAAMQPDESAESETPAAELVATLEVTP